MARRARSTMCAVEVAAAMLAAIALDQVDRCRVGVREPHPWLMAAVLTHAYTVRFVCAETRTESAFTAGPLPDLFATLPVYWRKKLLTAIAAELVTNLPHQSNRPSASES